ncbi:MAG: DUF72 domain-containing protein [Chloroflexota bacterium]
MSEQCRIHIGTSGWHYKHWKGAFYPADIRDGEMLRYYVGRLLTAEINNTFYRFPSEKALAEWRNAAPAGFTFAVKASRYITHMKKLKDAGEPVSNFVERVRTLGDKLGPILFQLPGHWHCDRDRLDAFLGALPTRQRYAFEFRDPSWLEASIYESLSRAGAAFCVYDFDGRQSPRQITADFVYVRLHGPDGAYQGSYDDEQLSDWARQLLDWAGGGKEVYFYFDNDEKGYAVQNALTLRRMVAS